MHDTNSSATQQAPNTISAMEARKRFGQILEEAFYRGDSFIIERSGRAMAVLVPVETYSRLQAAAHENSIPDPSAAD